MCFVLRIKLRDILIYACVNVYLRIISLLTANRRTSASWLDFKQQTSIKSRTIVTSIQINHISKSLLNFMESVGGFVAPENIINRYQSITNIIKLQSFRHHFSIAAPEPTLKHFSLLNSH